MIFQLQRVLSIKHIQTHKKITMRVKCFDIHFLAHSFKNYTLLTHSWYLKGEKMRKKTINFSLFFAFFSISRMKLARITPTRLSNRCLISSSFVSSWRKQNKKAHVLAIMLSTQFQNIYALIPYKQMMYEYEIYKIHLLYECVSPLHLPLKINIYERFIILWSSLEMRLRFTKIPFYLSFCLWATFEQKLFFLCHT